jgi:formylglycine-generating enzyme required for sulfatase activity
MDQTTSSLTCPACGEPLKTHWKICPHCETRLKAPACPDCGRVVEAHWRRCPECEAPLVSSRGQEGWSAGHTQDPQYPEAKKVPDHVPATFTDTLCGIKMVYLAGGSFQMGDTSDNGMDDESPVHTVHLDGFYMAVYPVTQAQWLTLMPGNPSHFRGDDLPLEQVTWVDAQHFAQKMTAANQDRYQFALPSEAQWEYAARSGGGGDLYSGGDQIDALAWYVENSQGQTHTVGTKAANRLGLFDMSGNVLEWCQDSYTAEAYDRHGSRNPVIELPVAHRVIRGGSWNLDAWSARCARRTSLNADYTGPGLGFRLVMVPA